MTAKLSLAILLLFSIQAIGQVCPSNIGFERGNFDNWECFIGNVNPDGTLSLSPTSPVPGRHTIIKNSIPQLNDVYGNFPTSCPNGSGYSIQLGNSATGKEAERVSYTFTIPDNQTSYSIIYNYAVVFQNPNHQDFQQPRFTAKVFNVTDNVYTSCGSFEFVASSNLPGFKQSPLGSSVFYKPWSPVTLNLSGLEGKTVRIEFTTNDCTLGGHFGYAYLDVNENCASPISGNVYCSGASSLILSAPFGFETYNWYNSDFSQLLGNSNILTINPPPQPGTKYAVEVIPYFGLGCHDTLYTTVESLNEPFNLSVLDTLYGCPSGVDLTAAMVTAGSSPGLTFSYFSDLNQLNYVPTPTKITLSGTYYIKGVNIFGCNDIKPIQVLISNGPDLKITDPAPACSPATVDITNASITTGSAPGLSFTYWKDLFVTTPLSNPSAVASSGTYYIQASSPLIGCTAIKPVVVQIGNYPTLTIHSPVFCDHGNLTLSAITSGSTAGVTFTYWMDPGATSSLPQPDQIMTSGTYYIKATTLLGCSVIKPVFITINPFPVFTVTDPQPVSYPVLTVDLTKTVTAGAGVTLSFWMDSLATVPVIHPNTVDKRTTYYVKAVTGLGCYLIKPIHVEIIPSSEPVIFAPNAFTPNNDGLNDVFKIKILGEITVHHINVYNRWGQVVYSSSDISSAWNGKFRGMDQPVGTYTWQVDAYDDYYKKSFSRQGTILLLR